MYMKITKDGVSYTLITNFPQSDLQAVQIAAKANYIISSPIPIPVLLHQTKMKLLTSYYINTKYGKRAIVHMRIL